MSEADKMFEEMDLIKTENEKSIGYINKEGTEFILLDLYKKELYIHKDNTEYPTLSVKELRAINKKCEELGWL